MANKADQRNNPKNHTSPLFKRLTKLFSGPIVNFRAQKPTRERKFQLDKYASKFNSLQGLSYKKNVYNPFDSLRSGNMAIQSRAERYVDFEQMEFYPELASALDVYADEMTTFTEVTKLLRIDCQNEEIKNILDTLFYKTLNIESNLFNWARTMCKYGDFFLYLDTDEVLGVKSAIGLPSQEIERLEGQDQTNPNYLQFQWNAGGLTFENWQIAHFRVLGNDKYTPYGTSVLDPARRIWRQLILVEDAMMAARVIRAPDRKVFEIDVSGIPPEDVEQYMQRVITQMKRHQVVDDTSGQVDLRYNPMSVEEDYYLPVRAGSVSKITPLAGQKGIDSIDDIKYLKNKLFAAIKIPGAYLSQSESEKEDKSTLAQKDIRFARTVQRLQRAMLSEMEKIGIVHLYTLGFRGDDLISFKLSLNNPSRIAMMQELEGLNQKLDVATKALGANFFSRQYVSKNIFGMSDEDFEKIERQRFYDKRVDAAIEASAQDMPSAGDMSGMGGPSLSSEPSGGIEGGLGGGPGSLSSALTPPAPEGGGAEETPSEGGGEKTPAPGEEGGSSLLAAPPSEAPAKRDSIVARDKKDRPVKIEYADGAYITLGSKGKKYKPVDTDKREDRGPFTRHVKSLWGSQAYGKNSKRNVFGFGYVTSDRLAKGIAESIDTNYNKSAEDQLNKLDRDLEATMEE
jgi:hypothetical protein